MAGVSKVDFDWEKKAEEFDERKTGVKGLVDVGVTEIPRLFVHPHEVIDRYPTSKVAAVELPVIDLTGGESGGARRREVVEAIDSTSSPYEEKESLYTYERSKLVKCNSNLPAHKGDPACWRDVLNLLYTDDHLDPLEIPSACRKELEEYVKYMIEDTLGGLQMLRDNLWVDVPPVPGALIANFSDLMQILSNDEFISVEHRVLSQLAGPRISMATF
ncbi:hypothetical protein SASPL_137713 [Salvia splendens]|uniref:Fe2OG dioxygenase domain-containing protein n=1 Tax=Salvia splendens TaxID=180675 RepID=A0A8X8WTC8_SALSN|nr:hypothetical protein SASPL_137713 [Salvia splendens]